MRLNTNIIILPEPVVVYDDDCEKFFLKIGSYVTSNAELFDSVLEKTNWNMDKAVYKGVRISEYPINGEGKILKEDEPFERFFVLGPRNRPVSVTATAIKKATSAGFCEEYMFKNLFDKTKKQLEQFGVSIQLLNDGDTVSFKPVIELDESWDGCVHVTMDEIFSDNYGGVLFDDYDPAKLPAEKIADAIVEHINHVAPHICNGKLFIDLKVRNRTDVNDYDRVEDLVRNCRSEKWSNWEIKTKK